MSIIFFVDTKYVTSALSEMDFKHRFKFPSMFQSYNINYYHTFLAFLSMFQPFIFSNIIRIGKHFNYFVKKYFSFHIRNVINLSHLFSVYMSYESNLLKSKNKIELIQRLNNTF